MFDLVTLTYSKHKIPRALIGTRDLSNGEK